MNKKIITIIMSTLLYFIPTNAKDIQINSSINNIPDSLASRYQSVGQNLARIGLYNEALDSLTLAIELYSQSNDIENYIISSELLANNLTYMGQIEEAIQVGLKIVDYCSTVYGENSLWYYTALQNLATYYGYAGDYKQGYLYNQHVLNNCNDEYINICAKEGLGIVLMNFGDHQSAIEYMDEALNYFIHKKNYYRVANLQHNIGCCYAEMSNLLFAIRYELSAMTSLEELYSNFDESPVELELNPLYNKLRHMLAVYYARLQVYDVAISHEDNVLRWIKVTQGETSVDYINSLISLAYMYKSNGRADKWEELTVKAYNLCMQYHLGNKKLLSEIYERMVELEDSKQNQDLVEALVAEATRCKKDYLLYTFSGLTENDRRNLWDKESYWFENTIPQLAVKYKTEALNSQLYSSIIFFKGLLLQSSQNIKALFNSSTNSEIRLRYQEIQESYQQIELLEEHDEYRNTVDSLKAVIANKERLLVATCPEIEDYFKSVDIDWKRIQETLLSDEIAVEFFYVQTGLDSFDYYTATINSTCRIPQVDFVCSSSDIEIIKPVDCISNEFAELIWGNIACRYPNVKRIYFSPIGLLNSYPIEYLEVPNNYKCEKFRLTSTRELAINNEIDWNFSSAVLYGGIDFNSALSVIVESDIEYNNECLGASRGADVYPLLSGTEVEVNTIADILQKNKLDVNLYTGDECSERSLKDLSANDISILHIATHGFYYTGRDRTKYFWTIGKTDPWVKGNENGLSPMHLSGLLLAGGNNALRSYNMYQEDNNGILTAEEASKLTLENTQLLVLSACETGLGEITNEGVIGIQRGFKMAGVQSIIMSLWEVDDDATCFIMEQFYSNLMRCYDPYLAFNKAINKVKKFKGKRMINGKIIKRDYTDPYYWAAFILVDTI